MSVPHGYDRAPALLHLQVGGDRFVGQEHELFDQPVRHVAVEGDNRLDHAARIDDLPLP